MRCEKGVVVWDDESASEFREAYAPGFDSVPDGKLKRFFGEATLMVKNSPCGEVKTCCERIALYNLLIAWMAQDDARGVGIVGHIASAAQGSVSLGLKPLSQGAASDPYMTNDYGKKFWLATAKYRTFFYAPDPYRRPRRPQR